LLHIAANSFSKIIAVLLSPEIKGDKL